VDRDGRKMFKNTTYRGHTFGIAIGIIMLALMLVGGAGASTTVWVDGSPLPFTWNYINFDGFNIGGFGTENLTILQTNLGASQRTIDKGNLIYSTQAQAQMLKVVSEQYNYSVLDAAATGLNETSPGQAFYGGNYFVMGWQGQPYVALNGKVDKLTKLVIDQGSENKTFVAGESWDVGDGWTLKVNSIDVNAIPRQVNLTLSKDGIKKEDRIVTSGTADAKPIYTYVEPAIAGETDVPLFVTYVDSVFLDGATDRVKLRYTWAISTSVTQLRSSDTYGVFKDAAFDENVHAVYLKNFDVNISLNRNSTQNLMGNLAFRVDDTSSLRFYPTVIAPATGSVHNINKGTNYATIQSAINDANSGDEIHVDSGTYYENVNVTKQLILKGVDTGEGKPIVNANASGNAITLIADGITLDGFEAMNSSNWDSSNWPYAGIKVISNNNIITGNNVLNNSNGIRLYYSNNNTVFGNEVFYNRQGVYLVNSSNNIVISNKAMNNITDIDLLYSNNNMLSNNTANSSIDGIILYASSNNTLNNNNVSNNNKGITLFYSSNIVRDVSY
jgi:S-layer protein (TIGR01567 family)